MDVLCLTALRDCPDRLDEAACWFHEKWGIPAEVYRDSIRQGIRQKAGIRNLERYRISQCRTGRTLIENETPFPVTDSQFIPSCFPSDNQLYRHGIQYLIGDQDTFKTFGQAIQPADLTVFSEHRLLPLSQFR